MNRFRTLRRSALATLAAGAVLAGCGSGADPNPAPVEGTAIDATATATAVPTTTRTTPPRGQTGDDLGGDVGFAVDIGDCVRLEGPPEDATISAADCGSEESNFKVVAKAPTQAECPSDIDQSYYVTFGDVEQGALCLDVDWVVGDCFDVGSENPARIDCPGAPNTARSGTGRFDDAYLVTAVLADTVDVERCPDPATGGFRYPERGFVVCFDTL